MIQPKYNVGDIVCYMGYAYANCDPDSYCDKCGQLLPNVEVRVDKKLYGEITRITVHVGRTYQKIWYVIHNTLLKPKTVAEKDILGRE